MSSNHKQLSRRAWLQLASYFKNSPAEYLRTYLNRTPTAKQEEILEKLQNHPYRCLVPSANTVGKTFLAAAQASYTFDCLVPSVTLATAPTKVSVRDLLFKELRRIRPTLDGFAPRETRLEYNVDHYVHGFTAAKGDSFQGRHEENLGLLFDEATGVDATFWERGETMFGGHPGHWWLATYNPNDITSYAFQVEESAAKTGWHVVRLSALEHPNIEAELRGSPCVVPSAIRLDTVRRRIKGECLEVKEKDFDPVIGFKFDNKYYHPQTPQFEAQILGRWPIVGSESIWSPIVFDKCRNNIYPLLPDLPYALGCDVARFGDDNTTIAVRRGPALIHLEAISGYNTKQIAERLKVIVNHLTQDSMTARLVPVYIDCTGGYGSGVVDQSDGHMFLEVNSCEKSLDPRFPNIRSWLWWNMRYIADSGACDFSRISDYEAGELKKELCAPRYHLDRMNRRVVEIKTQVKERLKRSPDRADAVNLCYYLGA